jgi:anti-anti-sigma regulatory factor
MRHEWLERGAANHVMQVQFLEEGERLVARPQGRMEAADGTGFAAAVQERLHAHLKFLTIDLEELDFVNLGGVRALLRLARSLKADQRELDFARGGHAVREALHHAGLNDLFTFSPPYHSHRGLST